MAQNLEKVPISRIGGLSRGQRQQIAKLNIFNVYDLLTMFPYKYRQVDPFSLDKLGDQTHHLRDGQMTPVRIERETTPFARPLVNGVIRLSFEAVLVNQSGQAEYNKSSHDEISFKVNLDVFRLPKYRKLLQGALYFQATGVYHAYNNTLSLNTYSGGIQKAQPTAPHEVSLLGRYHSKTGVEQGTIRQAVYQAYQQFGQDLPELVPANVRQAESLMTRKQALVDIHFPESEKQLKNAQYTEKYNELFQYEMKLQKISAKRKRKPGFAIKYRKSDVQKFTHNLPYKLTHDQAEAKTDVLNDLQKPYKMNRLVQGDVGSGKTVVAAYGILATISGGYQAALMAPTSVLSEQHYATFKNAFKGMGIKIALLNGRTSAPQRRKVRQAVRDGSVDLLIGTHSLYQKSLHYHKLGFAVVDEQQLFGVKQRKALSEKTRGCNVLSLTATPIPRTLASSLFADLDTSIISQMPKGRKTVKTKWYRTMSDLTLKRKIEAVTKRHGQVFVVTRLVKPSARIHESDTLTTCYHLNQILDPKYKAQELNGQMPERSKAQIIKNFKDGKCQVLVATTIVGVGMDISNADLIIIYDADNYGLAQLHQLRGRVGRNSQQAYCILIADPNKKQKNGAKRMRAMETIHDGFKLSRVDLKMRHWGNLFGRMQHGLPDFKLANLANDDDMAILVQAEKQANRIIRDTKSA